MTEIDVSIVTGIVQAIPIPATFTDVLMLNGPCSLHGYSIRDVTQTAGLSNEGAVVSPGAGATIVQITGVPIGTWLVEWEVSLQGAAAAADANNFQITGPGWGTLNSINPGAAGTYPQDNIEETSNAVGTWKIVAIGAGTVGITYAAQLTLLPVSAGESVAELQDGNNPLMELSVGGNQADTRWFGDSGLWVRSRINYHPVSGQITGSIFARFSRHTG